MDAIRRDYEIHEQLGKGSYATVFRVVEKSTKQHYAVKVMDKARLGEKGMRQVQDEVSILRVVDHPNVIKLKEVCEDKSTCCLVMEIIGGGELFKRITQLQHYSERTACELMRNFMKILVYLHDQGIVHRDLKPDNLLLKESETDIQSNNLEVTSVMLADFGFAAHYRGKQMIQACGTPYYIAPELLQTGVYKTRPCYTPPPCDLWSAGIICYVLLCGYPPFRVPRDAIDAKSKLFKQIVKGKVQFDKGQSWDNISSEAKDFILKLLVVDQNGRLTAQQALEHRWFESQGIKDTHLSSSVDELKSFNSKNKIKGAVYGVEAAFRLMYTEACDKRGVRRNSSLLDQFESATTPLTSVDLSNTYLGPKGFEALLSILNKHPTLKTLKLSNSLIDTDQCVRLCKVLQDPKSLSQIDNLELSDNPLTHPAGRALLGMMQARRKIIHIVLSGTHISAALVRKIHDQATRNKGIREQAKTNGTPIRQRAPSGTRNNSRTPPGSRKPSPGRPPGGRPSGGRLPPIK